MILEKEYPLTKNNSSDEILLVRAILKISSAVDNLDKVSPEVLPKKLFHELQSFDRWFCKNTAEFTVEMALSDWEAYNDTVYFWMDGFDNLVSASCESKKFISLFLAKVVSGLKDLTQVRNSEVVAVFVNRIRTAVTKGLIKKVGIDMRDFTKLVRNIDSVFENIVYDEQEA